jgi:hypothetical protein
VGEEAFDETIIVADSGSLFIRGGWGREEVFIGLARGRNDQPDILINLTPLQQKRLVEALRTMRPKRRQRT